MVLNRYNGICPYSWNASNLDYFRNYTNTTFLVLVELDFFMKQTVSSKYVQKDQIPVDMAILFHFWYTLSW